MLRTIVRAALVGALVALNGTGSGFAATKDFHNPKINGNRLDWCVTWGADCGQAAADAFCVQKGYSNATDFTVDENIGDDSPTRLIGTGAICDQAECDSFSDITCSKASAKKFGHPEYNGAQLDWCVNWGQNCGQAAADKFCQWKGYSHASDFAESENIGDKAPTRLIGTGAICDQHDCDGFAFIECE